MSSRLILAGSESQHPKHSVPAGSTLPAEPIQITLVLRRVREIPSIETLANRLTHDEFAAAHGALPDDLEAVEKFARDQNLKVTRVDRPARLVSIEGSLTHLALLFGADLRLSELNAAVLRTRQGLLHVPAELANRVVAILGFDNRPVASTTHKRDALSLKTKAFTPLEVAKLYNFPASQGTGQTIALIELGGGFQSTDLQNYWKQLELPEVSVEAIAVDNVSNAPTGDSNSADGEVVLDIEVAGAVAPGANIAVYFAPNTDAGFLNAINAATHDTKRKPSVISISWGSAENEWSPQTINAFNAAFHDAALLGISVCAAAGDNGSSDGESDKSNHVDFPASSPWVLACGGTRLIGSNGQIQKETVWNDGTSGGSTGGGVSTHFTKPAYQANVNVPKPGKNKSGRGVPDVAGVADPETGFIVLVDGQQGVVGGTSAVAPLWAGLIALCNEQVGKNLGWLHPTLYGTVAQHKVLHDITTGTNGSYHASTGWDCCTGLGTPNGVALLDILKKS